MTKMKSYRMDEITLLRLKILKEKLGFTTDTATIEYAITEMYFRNECHLDKLSDQD